MPSAADPSARAIAAVVGRYVLCDEIAAGGMATVHLGRLRGSAGFSRTVAIKRLHAQFAKDPDFVAMFLDEARIAGGIRHPNVVPTLDVLIHEGEILVVMEYVHGESLSRLSRAQKGALDPRDPRATGLGVPLPIALTIVSGALYGLHAAHEARDDRGAPLEIVHRDVSPQNILVGLDGVVRVVDFGVAKAVGRLQMTREGMLKGKLAYMAPEQAASDAVDRRCDIYAASVVLWEALTGQRLFSGQNEMSLFRSVLAGAVTPPSAIVPSLPPAVDALVMRGLARDPADRFATALEMAEAAQQIAYASPGQVGTWVRALGGAALDQRAARVASIERTWAADAPALPDLAPPSASTFSRALTQPLSLQSEGNVSGSGSTRPTGHVHAVAMGPPMAAVPPTPPPQAAPQPYQLTQPLPRGLESASSIGQTIPLPPHLVAAAIASFSGARAVPPSSAPPAAPLVVPPVDVASQIITSLNIAPSPRRPSRAPLVLALTAPLVLVMLGTVLVLWRSSSPRETHESAASAIVAPAAPSPPPATSPEVPAAVAITPAATTATAAPTAAAVDLDAPAAEPTAVATASPVAKPRPPSATPSGTPAPRPTARAASGKAGCNPPYTVDARGVRVPKMECL